MKALVRARSGCGSKLMGQKLVENIVQATARDLLALAMLRLRDAGFAIVMHIHDEAVLEVPEGVFERERGLPDDGDCPRLGGWPAPPCRWL